MSAYWFLPLERIVSGGQTGADRAALDVARRYHFPHWGWCPKGRRSEDGEIPVEYSQLEETPSANYLQRTEWNVRDSDGTVIFTMGSELSGGSKRTAGFADRHGRPLLHLHSKNLEASRELRQFLSTHQIRVLNIAGSRGSKEPGLASWVFEFLSHTLFYKEPYSLIGVALSALGPEVELLGARDHAEASTVEKVEGEEDYEHCWRFYFKRRDNLFVIGRGYIDYLLVEKQSGRILKKGPESRE
mgnify:FL=1